MIRRPADAPYPNHPATIMSNIELTKAQTAALLSLEVWYEQYLTMVRALITEDDPIPLPSQFRGEDIDSWSNAVTLWITRHIGSHLMDAIRSTDTGEIVLKYHVEETNAAGSVGQVLLITTGMWDLFWANNAARTESNPFFQITDADRLVGVVLVRILAQNSSLRSIQSVWTIFDLQPSTAEYTLVYFSLRLSNRTLLELIQDSVASNQQLDLIQSWMLDRVLRMYQIKDYETVAWIRSHVEFTPGQEYQIKLVEGAARAASHLTTMSTDQLIDA